MRQLRKGAYRYSGHNVWKASAWEHSHQCADTSNENTSACDTSAWERISVWKYGHKDPSGNSSAWEHVCVGIHRHGSVGQHVCVGIHRHGNVSV